MAGSSSGLQNEGERGRLRDKDVGSANMDTVASSVAVVVVVAAVVLDEDAPACCCCCCKSKGEAVDNGNEVVAGSDKKEKSDESLCCLMRGSININHVTKWWNCRWWNKYLVAYLRACLLPGPSRRGQNYCYYRLLQGQVQNLVSAPSSRYGRLEFQAIARFVASITVERY